MRSADPKPKAKMGRPSTLRGPLGQLADILGSVAALAAEIGVKPRELNRWSVGSSVPSQPVRLLLAGLARMHKVDPPYETTPKCTRPAWLDEVDPK